ncbi:MAG: globin domain-containing protein [Proteobacteria bacterium]|nr:globin domain-containing protein [Pseudomonadota bacterium]
MPANGRHAGAEQSEVSQAHGSLEPWIIDAVQSSWAKVRPISNAAASLFYDRLFERDPSLRQLFKNDMSEQKRKLMQTLNVAVDGLRDPARMIPVLQDLGVRHAGYMVQEHHYDYVGEALLLTLREGLGDEFTDDVETAWTAVYQFIATVMKQAARTHIHVAGHDNPTAQRSAPSGAIPVISSPIQASHKTGPMPRPSATMAATPPVSQSRPGVLDPRTIELVQDSWVKVRPIADAVAALFYDRLFEIDPSTRQLFKSDMSEQKRKLMQTLTLAVDGLRAPGKLVPILEELGARHAGYMVQDHHYDRVGEALLWTLSEGLGEEFTDELHDAWTAVYTLVATVMKRGAAEYGGVPEPRGEEMESGAVSFAAVADPAVTSRPSDAGAAPYDSMSVTDSSQPIAAQLHYMGPDTAVERASVGPGVPRGMMIPVNSEDMTLNVRLIATPQSMPGLVPERSLASGLAIAILLAVVCGATVMTATSIMLFSMADFAEIAGKVPTFALYALPLAATLLTFTAFMLGYLWSRRTAPTGSAERGR